MSPNLYLNEFPYRHDSFLMQVIQDALRDRKGKDFQHTANNTYLREFPIPQIELFDALAHDFPLVRAAQAHLNAFYWNVLRGQERVDFLDLGIGRGIQVLEWLKACPWAGLKEVCIWGIDLHEGALEHSRQVLNQYRNAFPFKLSFRLFHLPFEALGTQGLWEQLKTRKRALIINASLALHHVGDGRALLLKNMAQAGAMAMGLIEPHAQSYQTSIEERFTSICLHFGALFDYIDGLSLNSGIKKGIKAFLSNDLYDALALPDGLRCELYSPGMVWWEAFTQLGMQAATWDVNPKQLLEWQGIRPCSHVPGCWELYRGEVPLLSILHFKSPEINT